MATAVIWQRCQNDKYLKGCVRVPRCIPNSVLGYTGTLWLFTVYQCQWSTLCDIEMYLAIAYKLLKLKWYTLYCAFLSVLLANTLHLWNKSLGTKIMSLLKIRQSTLTTRQLGTRKTFNNSGFINQSPIKLRFRLNFLSFKLQSTLLNWNTKYTEFLFQLSSGQNMYGLTIFPLLWTGQLLQLSGECQLNEVNCMVNLQVLVSNVQNGLGSHKLTMTHTQERHSFTTVG